MTVASSRWQKLAMHLTIWKVVVESSPVDVSSMNSVLHGLRHKGGPQQALGAAAVPACAQHAPKRARRSAFFPAH